MNLALIQNLAAFPRQDPFLALAAGLVGQGEGDQAKVSESSQSAFEVTASVRIAQISRDLPDAFGSFLQDRKNTAVDVVEIMGLIMGPAHRRVNRQADRK